MIKHKIYQLSKYYKPYFGGMESVVADISESFVGVDCDNTVIACASIRMEDNCSREEQIAGVKVVRCRELLSIASTSISLRYITSVFNRVNGSIVHVHMPNPLSNVALFVASFFGRKPKAIVLHWQSDIIKQKGLLVLYRPLLNWLLSKSDVIIVTSNEYLKCSEQLVGYESKCRLVPIGIPEIKGGDSVFLSSLRERYQGSHVVFSLGRHVYYKGFEYLIDAVSKTSNDAIFLIGGCGADTEKYRQRVFELGVEDKVIFLGSIPSEHLSSYFQLADIFCFPSVEKSEAFGVVQLEAMSVGVPVISCSIEGSGVAWVNKHMQSGLVCNPKNSAELARSIDVLLSDKALYSKLSSGARQRYNELFTREKMVESILKIYRELDSK